MDPRKSFTSNTLMGRQEQKKANQLLQSLIDSTDSFEFRQPVDYKTLGLTDYPLIVKRPMDLSTVRRNLNNNNYQSVENCLSDIQLIWENCKIYNTSDQWIYKQAEKIEKLTKKMIRNYVPFVRMENPSDRRRGPKKEAVVAPVKKAAIKVPQPEPKDYLQKKQEEEKPDQVEIESEFVKQRKHFLMYVHMCSLEQVGVIFMLIRNHAPEAVEYTEGKPDIHMDQVPDKLVVRLIDQLDMWGIGYVSSKKR